ncbi:MAG: CoA-binding protein [Deltaproteobacteria bacterium]|jgi:predicted CoA-binding protein|nr:CoA-binding protein [Deltaproteobacteria bacterium]MBW2537790.1 CoA-binding protein [Deltaproteobacteria bacterium]
MPSHYETFFERESFAVVGHSAKKPFPALTYGGLKKLGKKVFAVDPSTDRIEGDEAYDDFDSLPEKVEAAVIEIPREETREWIAKAAAAGIRDVWLHMTADTPEALALAQKEGLDVRHGTCAVQYVDGGFPHNVHKLIRKLLRRY